MVAGDWPSLASAVTGKTARVFGLLGPWLYLSLFTLSFALLAGVRGWKPPAGLAFLHRPVATLGLAFLASTLLSQAPALSWLAVGCFAVILAFLLAASWVLEEEEAMLAALSVTLAAAALVLAARVIGWRLAEGLHVAAFHVPNNAWLGKLQIAWVLNLVAPILFAGFLGARRFPLLAVYGTAWLASGLAVHVLFSRAGVLVFVVTTLLLSALNPDRWRRWLSVLAALTLVTAVVVLPRGLAMTRSEVASLLRPDRDAGMAMRWEVWRETLRMVRDRPLTGVGLGAYDDVAYTRYGTSGDPHFFRNGWHAHNLPLHLAAETGLLGVLAWGYLWLAVLRFLWRCWRTGDATQRLQASVGLGVVTAFFILSLTEVLIAARVHASLRMSLTLGLAVIYGVRWPAAGTRA